MRTGRVCSQWICSHRTNSAGPSSHRIVFARAAALIRPLAGRKSGDGWRGRTKPKRSSERPDIALYCCRTLHRPKSYGRVSGLPQIDFGSANAATMGRVRAGRSVRNSATYIMPRKGDIVSHQLAIGGGVLSPRGGSKKSVRIVVRSTRMIGTGLVSTGST